MRTKRTMGIMLILLGLVLGRDASAFYNPQTGRWLSRDPLHEIASLRVADAEPVGMHEQYVLLRMAGIEANAFVENNPINRYDLFGLASCDWRVALAKKSGAIKKMLAKLEKAGCPAPIINTSDDCCDPDAGGGALCDAKTKQSTITVCCRANAHYTTTLKHELYHAMDCCRGTKPNDCDEAFCSEVVAYYFNDCTTQMDRMSCALEGAKRSLSKRSDCFDKSYDVKVDDARKCIDEYGKRKEEERF